MTRSKIIVIGALICSSVVIRAQSPPIASTSLNNPDGTASLTVRNTSNSPLIAFVDVGVSHPVGSDGHTINVVGTRYRDAATDLNIEPLLPNQEITVQAGTPGSSATETFEAAVFADNTTFGDPEYVRQILRRRLLAHEGFDAVFSILENGLTANKDVSELRQECVDSKDKAAQQTSAFYERDAATRYHRLVIHNFDGGTRSAEGPPLTDAATIRAILTMLKKYQTRFVRYDSF